MMDTYVSEPDLQRLRMELRHAESHARSLRRRLKSLGGVRSQDRTSLTQRVVEFLDHEPGLEFSPADVRRGIDAEHDVASILRSLVLQGRVTRTRRGIYRSVRSIEGATTT